ncbi:hypothetical protein GUITHDRAFT_146782 [Guillardia theta CCMP2712]|uniref:Uncharacterized protein n=1 Tax=Guillardia theta (strain CCMP2712) TaxID=905079 RepID=L1IGR9_GUITC|nr:hypothetical protein GUITHDRAFT_146782 [Guillardia theta CCMP2712]EKX35030.1 hypothetical protein GUITHDRAFT_146782 [Guillardia theta CCMP2712]|eukprot:XP_005822010.1 hypothetical protein GUITHDRAFT_146782 [Guillardia theta CCMP2712]
MGEVEDEEWSMVKWNELMVWTLLAVVNFFQQVGFFFILMLSGPGFSNDNLPFCDSLRFISNNLADMPGIASYLVVIWIMQWFILGIVSCQKTPLVNRDVSKVLASISYIGVFCVVLYNQGSDREDLHLLGAVIMILPVLIAQFLIATEAFTRASKDGHSNPHTVAPTLSLVTMSIISMTTIMGLLYCFLYLLNRGGFASVCMSAVVILEYVVYFMLVINNLLVYFDFTAMHAYSKLNPKAPRYTEDST